MSNLKLGKQTALNLTLQGSTGSFRIGSDRTNKSSFEVKYLLTHVGLNFNSTRNDALLSELAPVREIFDFQSLDFDELMQRDIDDSRVSHELIPYLLDENTVDLVKLFPPVVVVVLPVEPGENRPANRYENTSWVTLEEETDDSHGLKALRSGDVGEEIFEFEQPIQDKKLLEHDLVKLKLNTKRCRLVIVDGQHRAMSLLALHRNLKEEWTDERRAPFKEYYAEWTPNYIRSFKLEEVSLPLMICTIPSIDASYDGEYDLKQAARSIFLTLNKNARKVSESRNRLLDDNDLVAYFLRVCLSDVKSKDKRSPHSLRIANVELDQVTDKAKIQSPMAITGVNHLYYIIEQLLLNDGNIKGVSARSGKFYSRKDLSRYGCFKRLNASNILGQKITESTSRDNFSLAVADKLTKPFMSTFGDYIVGCLERFSPWEQHNRAALNLDLELEKHKDRQLKPMLFDGQGIGRVFESHRTKLGEKIKQGKFSTDVPEIEATLNTLNATADRLNSVISGFQLNRAELYLDSVSDKKRLLNDSGIIGGGLVKWVNKLFDETLTTVAFQSALICGFFCEVERIESASKKAGKPIVNREELFEEYLEQVNQFFKPKTFTQLRKLTNLFSGDLADDNVMEWKTTRSKFDFRSVVYRGEMQPDQWPKYKYLILELWETKNEELQASLQRERTLCRKQVFTDLSRSYRTDYCREHQKLEEKLSDSERDKIEKDAYKSLTTFLKNLGSSTIPDFSEVKVSAEDALQISSFESEDD